jgi:hypothetical protein
MAQAAAGAKAAPAALVPGATAAPTPAKTQPCNATVAALGLCDQ